VLRPRDINKDTTHEPRGHRQEVRAILPLDILSVDQSQIGLIHQGRGLKAVAGPLSLHAPPGDAVQLLLHQRNEPLQRGLVAPSPCQEKPGYAARSGHDAF
jgi:hypothetical protein